MENNFFIKKDYQINPSLKTEGNGKIYWTKNRITTEHINAQYYVYKYSKKLIKRENLKSVIDIGCGNAEKLIKIIYPICKNISVIDESRIIDVLEKKYKFINFYRDDLNDPKLNIKDKFDLIICADVIEHIENPSVLLNYIKNLAHKNTLIIISTPERDILRGYTNKQSPNKTHIREWNKNEFYNYLKSNDFFIIIHKNIQAFRIHINFKNNYQKIKKQLLDTLITLKRFDSLNKIKYNQVVVCKIDKINSKSFYIVIKIFERPLNILIDVLNYLKIKFSNIFHIFVRIYQNSKSKIKSIII